MKHRVRVAAGLVVVAALVGIGVYPVRKGLSVRFKGSAAPRKKRPVSRRQRRRKLAQRLLFWW